MVALKTGPTQRFCPKCSERRDLERKRLWAHGHPLSPEEKSRNVKYVKRRRELSKEAGSIVNGRLKSDIAWYDSDGPELLWVVRVGVPFTYAASKNHIYTKRLSGHLALRREAKALRTAIAASLRRALSDQKVAHNKVWIDILIQKPDHRRDAVNVVDLVCDAVKNAVPGDDRWLSIRRLDWEIVKDAPMLFIGIGQETDADCQVCSYCGQIKPLDAFNRRHDSPLGVGRQCRECRRKGRRLKKRRERGGS